MQGFNWVGVATMAWWLVQLATAVGGLGEPPPVEGSGQPVEGGIGNVVQHRSRKTEEGLPEPQPENQSLVACSSGSSSSSSSASSKARKVYARAMADAAEEEQREAAAREAARERAEKQRRRELEEQTRRQRDAEGQLNSTTLSGHAFSP